MAWEFLSSTVLGASSSTIDSGTIDAKNNLYVEVFGIPDGNLDACVLRFNGSTSDYAVRKQQDGGTGSTNTNESGINYMSSNTSTDSHYAAFQIMNIDGDTKLVIDRTCLLYK